MPSNNDFTTKLGSVDWVPCSPNVDHAGTQTSAPTQLLNANALGYDPKRRAHQITLTGCEAGNEYRLQIALSDDIESAANWLTVLDETVLTGATEYRITDSQIFTFLNNKQLGLGDTDKIQPNQMRLQILGGTAEVPAVPGPGVAGTPPTGGDPGTITVLVTSKHIPSTMRRA